MASTIQQIETPKRARALDTSGNNNHGQIYSGRALEFDGISDYFQHNGAAAITGVNRFNDGSPWTFACWMYFNSSATTAQFFVGKDEDVKPHLMKPSNSSGVEIRFREDGSGDYYKFTTGGYPPYDTWHRVVVTTDGTTMTAYINGVLFGSFTKGDADHDGNGTVFSTTKMHFTGWGHPYETGGNRSYAFNGMMSDGQVWDAAWTADDASYDYLNPEFLALNRGGTSLTNSNLKMWYPMQDGHRGQQSYILDASNTGLGDNILVNPTFDTSINIGTAGSGWSSDGEGGSSIATFNSGGGKIFYDGTNTSRLRAKILDGTSQNVMTIGTTYKLVYEVIENNNVSVLRFSAPTTVISNSVGTYTYYFTATTQTFQFFLGGGDNGDYIIVDNVYLYPVNDKHNATTVFYGDELIASDAADNRTFDNDTGNWVSRDASGTDVALANVGNKLQVTTTTTNEYEGAKLGIAHIGDGSTTSIVVGRSYRVSMDLELTTPSSGTFAMDMNLAGAASGSFNITTTETTYTKDFVAENTTGNLLIYNTSGTQSVFTVDNVSVKEIGTASGWTDADQQLHIQQTALQSYNELTFSTNTEDGTSNNAVAIVSHHIDHNPEQGDFTVNCWVFLDDWGTGHGQYIMHKGGGGIEGWHIRVKDDGTLQFQIEEVDPDDGGDADDGVTVVNSSAAGAISLGKWHMITCTIDYGNTISMYINGELAQTPASISGITETINKTANIYLLNYSENYDHVTSGTATEWSIFKGVAFNQTQVNELYNDGKALDVTTHSEVDNLKGYWRNDGLNTTWKNIHNPGTYDATLYNATETMLIPQGVDGSRDSQGFIMNKQRDTSSLNLAKNNDTANYTGPGMEVYNTKDATLDGQFDSSGDGLGDFTIEFWFKTNQNLSSGSSVLYQSATYSAPNWSGLDIHLNSNGSIGVFLYRGASSGGASLAHSNNGTSADQDYADGNWHHVVFVADRSAKGTLIIDKIVESYIDINEYDHDSDAATAMLDITDVVCFKGSQRVGSSTSAFQGGGTNRSALNGQIDGFKIYNDLLTFDTADGSITEGEEITSGQVLKNYNATKHNHKN